MKEIAKALAKAQSEMSKALKQSSNPHFKSKYADLASVTEACLPALNSNGIAVIQPIIETDLGRSVKTVFIHASGEQLEATVPLMIGKQDMQGLGSAITYARRYGLMCLAGIAPEDDDGNAAASSPQTRMSWAETVIAEQCEDGASDEEKAEALTLALIAQFKRKKTEGELSNEWDRRAKITSSFAERFPDKHSRIVDAYENRMLVITKQDVPSSHPAGEK